VSVCPNCTAEVDQVRTASGTTIAVDVERVDAAAVDLLFRLDFGDRRPFYSRLSEANLASAHRGPYRRPHALTCPGSASRGAIRG
jgi:hypothetical protein